MHSRPGKGKKAGPEEMVRIDDERGKGGVRRQFFLLI